MTARAAERHDGRTDATAAALDPIRFTVAMLPQPKLRHRTRTVTTRDGRSFTQSYQPAKTRRAEEDFTVLAAKHAPAVPFAGAIRLRLVFYMPIPISKPRWWREAAERLEIRPITKPDYDNLAKLVGDAMTNSGQWWRDDSQIVDCHCQKFYSLTPRLEIEVAPIPEPDRPLKHRFTSPSDQPSIFGDQTTNRGTQGAR